MISCHQYQSPPTPTRPEFHFTFQNYGLIRKGKEKPDPNPNLFKRKFRKCNSKKLLYLKFLKIPPNIFFFFFPFHLVLSLSFVSSPESPSPVSSSSVDSSSESSSSSFKSSEAALIASAVIRATTALWVAISALYSNL